MSHNLPWIEKYRPQHMSEMIDHEEKIKTLKNQIENNSLTHLIFYGNPGSGKTSLIFACAREMYGEKYADYILDLNASGERGIEVVRKKIIEFARIKMFKTKLIILDEADSLTIDAQRALRCVIEDFSKTTRFCLICNNINKIIPGLQSRCVKMRFGHLSQDKIKSKLDIIISQEKVNISKEAIDRLININYDFRQIINTLQCLHAINSKEQNTILPDDINRYLGIPTDKEVNYVLQEILKLPYDKACLFILDRFRDNRWTIGDLVKAYSKKYLLEANKIEKTKLYEFSHRLADIDFKIKQSGDGEIQLLSLVSALRDLKSQRPKV